MEPLTIYGMTKIFMEKIGTWMNEHKDLDFRSVRYPGIISPAEPGGGTTDYAVGIQFPGKKG